MPQKSYAGGRVTETKQIERNGVPVGVVKGYIATWDVDRGDWSGIKDKFMPGAFLDSIARHKETDRPVRLNDHHGRTVGGFPIDNVFEDSKGLFGTGELNLDVQQGAEAFALAKQGVLSDFSIGWELLNFSMEEDVRIISKAELWECSVVSEPMNPHAVITEVKSLSFKDIGVKDIRELEKALRNGITFSNNEAKQIISLMKDAGMLRDEQDGRRDGEMLSKADEIINLLKGI